MFRSDRTPEETALLIGSVPKAISRLRIAREEPLNSWGPHAPRPALRSALPRSLPLDVLRKTLLGYSGSRVTREGRKQRIRLAVLRGRTFLFSSWLPVCRDAGFGDQGRGARNAAAVLHEQARGGLSCRLHDQASAAAVRAGEAEGGVVHCGLQLRSGYWASSRSTYVPASFTSARLR
jgi:hypothetical protein